MAISNAVDLSAVARVVGIKTEFKDLRQGNILFLPQRIAIIGQGSTVSTYPTTKQQITSALQAATLYGFGSPIHLAARQLLPINGDGVGSIPVTVYPLVDDGSGVVSTGDITPSGSQTESAAYIVRINNIDSQSFVISVGDSLIEIVTAMADAINATLEIPVVAVADVTPAAEVVDFTSKWKGVSANEIVVEIIGSTTAGTSFAITQPVGGLVNPDIDAALAQVGNIWETLFLNCLEITDTATLEKYTVFGESRWGALTRKPMVAFTGTNEVSITTAIVIPESRKSDRVNCQLVSPGSNDLPFVIAARQLSRIALIGNNNPARDYGSQQARGLVPGADGVQWDYPTRDQAVKAGSSTVEIRDNIVTLSDTVTFYHPQGDAFPAYRYVVDIIKLQNIIFNLDLLFANDEWDGAPLIPDDQPTVNPDAKKPKTAVAAVASMVDSLGLNAIISNPEQAKQSIQADISDSNPKRLDLSVTVQLSGNVNIVSVDLNFGFLFGSQQPL